MIGDFFRHSCDIYHHADAEKAAKFGLPAQSDKERTYPQSASLSGVPCFFIRDSREAIIVSEPQNVYDGSTEVSLPAGTEIYQGDIVVDLRYQISYTAGFPEDVRGKYISVPLYRTTRQGGL